MNSGSWRDRADRLRLIPLESVLRSFGAQPDRYDTCKWHTSHGVLSVKGVKYMDWKQGGGGGGAIDLAMHLNGLSFAEALQWLEHRFPIVPALHCGPTTPSQQLLIPPPHPENLPRVQEYLTRQRRLPLELLRTLNRSGDVYADSKANAVFLLRGANGQPVGAELRGTTIACWRGMAPGSRKNDGYFSASPKVDDPRRPIILCESAIDAISCFALHPDYRCISTAGARPNPHWLRNLIQPGVAILCGFDTDATAEAMAASMKTLHPSIGRLRPRLHDWNDLLAASL